MERSPSQVREAVVEGVPVAAEPVREVERGGGSLEERFLVTAAGEVDARGLQPERARETAHGRGRRAFERQDLDWGGSARPPGYVGAHGFTSTRRNVR